MGKIPSTRIKSVGIANFSNALIIAFSVAFLIPILSISLAEAWPMDQAIELVNSHSYGNGASIYTTKGSTARLFSDRVNCGMLGVNVSIPVPIATHSFGGWKDSRLGSGVYGPSGFEFYTKVKTVTSHWEQSEQVKTSFSMPNSREI